MYLYVFNKYIFAYRPFLLFEQKHLPMVEEFRMTTFVFGSKWSFVEMISNMICWEGKIICENFLHFKYSSKINEEKKFFWSLRMQYCIREFAKSLGDMKDVADYKAP